MELLLFYSLVILFVVIILFYLRLSARISHCEQALKKLHNAGKDQIPLFDQDVSAKQSGKSAVSPPLPSLEKPKEPEAQAVKQKPLRKPFKIPNIVKENWIGVFGSVALVIGVVFFGLTAEIMQHAEVRVGIMMVVSFLFLGMCQKLKNRPDWTSICSWLKSIAGTVILFAAIGAGGVEGLQFIYTPLYVLLFLCFGISINILLAITTPTQAIASLHVILSIIAFCIAPQALILLPIGALVACTGLLAAYRSKWDLHLLLIVIAFACQNTIWTLSLDTELLAWMHYMAIGSSTVVSLIGASIHYNKKYQSQKLEVLPLIAHIANWGLLTWNIGLHAQFTNWTPLILGFIAVAGFILSRNAKKKKIYWLFYTDTLLSQLVMIAAIASLSHFSIRPLDLGLMVLVETLIFNFVCRLHKEDFLLQAGCCIQYVSYLAVAYFTFEALSITSIGDQFPIYFRMGVITGLSWYYHTAGVLKNFSADDFRFILFKQKDQPYPVSITTLFGTFFFLGIYFFGFNSLVIQAAILFVVALVALWRKKNEDHSWDITFIIALVFIHIMNWNHLAQFMAKESTPSILLKVDLLGTVFLDIFLIFGNFLQFKLWKKNIHNLVIYALGIQMGLLTYVFTKEVSILIPGLVFLGFSVLALEASRTVFSYNDDVKFKIREGMIHVGLAFLIAFLSRYVTVNIQINPIWHGISMRWITEAMGILTIVYWIAFYPRNGISTKFTEFCGEYLVDVCLGFITLCIFVEAPEVWRPFFWAIIAIGLLFGALYDKWPKRFSGYSWFYLAASIVHVGFVTSSLAMPSLFLVEQHNIPALMAIALQLGYSYMAHRSSGVLMKIVGTSTAKGITKFIPALYRQTSLTVLLPVFLGIALLFAFNYEKAVLTFLWVGLTCVYLVVGLMVKSKMSIQIAMAALVLCSIRLIIFDLVQSDLATRALVFIGVGSLMLGVSFLYKKYKHRIEVHESV